MQRQIYWQIHKTDLHFWAVRAIWACIWNAVALLGGINPNAQSHRNSPRIHTRSHIHPEMNNTERYIPLLITQMKTDNYVRLCSLANFDMKGRRLPGRHQPKCSVTSKFTPDTHTLTHTSRYKTYRDRSTDEFIKQICSFLAIWAVRAIFNFSKVAFLGVGLPGRY